MDYSFAYAQGFRDIEEVVLTVFARYNGTNYRIEVLRNCKNDQNPFGYRTYVAVEDKAKSESIWKQCFASYDGQPEERGALKRLDMLWWFPPFENRELWGTPQNVSKVPGTTYN